VSSFANQAFEPQRGKVIDEAARTYGRSMTLSHAKQIELVTKPWNVAFSKEVNLKAWEQVCFSSDSNTRECPPACTAHS
jgi:hypothetical protein